MFTLWQKLAEFLIKIRPLESASDENIPLNMSRRDSRRENFMQSYGKRDINNKEMHSNIVKDINLQKRFDPTNFFISLFRARDRKRLKKAQSKIINELDLQKFIHRVRL